MHQKKPLEFETQPDPVLNNVIVLYKKKLVKKLIKICFKIYRLFIILMYSALAEVAAESYGQSMGHRIKR